ncbi:MAG TPA: protease HtpX [Vicinamibacteria bacterium]|nr:protease HtpX [Vicinamibacteria bacterium]
MAKRVFLFVLTNIAILAMVSIVLAVLGQMGVLGLAGRHGTLLIYCAIWGFGASLVSLLLSRWMAKRAMGVHLIGPDVRDADEQWLYATVSRLAQQANLPMPEVGIYDSPEVNAFATGPSKKRSLVAVSTGLFRSMGRQEREGVLAHEISHVANGDMVTMALIQGVVNAFVLYLAHVVAMIARNALSSRDDDRPSYAGFMVGQLVFIAAQIVFGLIGSMVTAWFSRHREFRADAGGAALAGRGSMVSALRRLLANQGRVDDSKPQYATFKISGGKRLFALLATHPPLEQRIAALEQRV